MMLHLYAESVTDFPVRSTVRVGRGGGEVDQMDGVTE